MHKSVIAITMVAFAAAGTAGCATKGYVRTQVGQVSEKVDTLSQSLEETQKRTQANETRIGEVDSKAGAAGSAADKAGTAAAAADQRAAAAGQSAQAAQTKANAVETASKRVVFEVVLNENQGNFKFGKVELPDEAKAAIDDLVGKIKANPNAQFFEIEGHTDNAGDKVTNERIGMERADAVKRYLYEQHQIPLHRMNVISYGEDKPAADNKTRDGRAQNRRVVIKVLA